MNSIEKQIRADICDLPDNAFDKKNIKKLVGYAEMHGNEFIPLYKDLNFIALKPGDSLELIESINPNARYTSGDLDTIIGHLKLEDGTTILLQDKQLFIEKLTLQYQEDKVELSEDESYEGMALEWYYYNTLGAYMEGVPAFAVLYSK